MKTLSIVEARRQYRSDVYIVLSIQMRGYLISCDSVFKKKHIIKNQSAPCAPSRQYRKFKSPSAVEHGKNEGARTGIDLLVRISTMLSHAIRGRQAASSVNVNINVCDVK